MQQGLLRRAFALAGDTYFMAGYYMARTLTDHSFLALHTHDHPSRLYQQLGNVWNRAKIPLQRTLTNKMLDSVLKGDFSPRPTSTRLKSLALPLLEMTAKMLPRLLSTPALPMAIAVTGLILLDDNLRQLISDQVAHLIAPLHTQSGDTAQMATAAAKTKTSAIDRSVMTGARPSIS